MSGPMQWKDNLSPSSLSKLSTFADLILRWNSKINLTGYRTRKEIDELLIGESVLGFRTLEQAGIMKSGATILDFGSGAGIPGLVWVAMEVPIEVRSLEIRQKKVAFQKEVVRELGLKAEITLGRFPEAVFGESFDLVVSRAIRFDPKLWEKGRPLLKPAGYFVRFAVPEVAETGWRTLPVSVKTSLLVSA
jgi:16S rRNA (guanine527-N7)-methyltransferase